MTKIVLHVQAHGNHNVVRLYRQGARRTKTLLCKVLASGEANDIMLTHWVDTAIEMAKKALKANAKWQYVYKNDFEINSN